MVVDKNNGNDPTRDLLRATANQALDMAPGDPRNLFELANSPQNRERADDAPQQTGSQADVRRIDNAIEEQQNAIRTASQAQVRRVDNRIEAEQAAAAAPAARDTAIRRSGVARTLVAATPSLHSDLRQAQAYAKLLGYHPGALDGVRGPQTDAALRQFRQKQGLAENASMADTLKALKDNVATKMAAGELTKNMHDLAMNSTLENTLMLQYALNTQSTTSPALRIDGVRGPKTNEAMISFIRGQPRGLQNFLPDELRQLQADIEQDATAPAPQRAVAPTVIAQAPRADDLPKVETRQQEPVVTVDVTRESRTAGGRRMSDDSRIDEAAQGRQNYAPVEERTPVATAATRDVQVGGAGGVQCPEGYVCTPAYNTAAQGGRTQDSRPVVTQPGLDRADPMTRQDSRAVMDQNRAIDSTRRTNEGIATSGDRIEQTRQRTEIGNQRVRQGEVRTDAMETNVPIREMNRTVRDINTTVRNIMGTFGIRPGRR